MQALPEEIVRQAYDAFNRQDADAVLALMQPDVAWPNTFEGGQLRGREEVKAYWQRQWAQIKPEVLPESTAQLPDGRLAVLVSQTLFDLNGKFQQQTSLMHVYSFEDGLIAGMEIGAA